jgi:hypothetical protein
MLNPFLYNHLSETKINNKHKTVQITQPHTRTGNILKSISILLYIKRKKQRRKSLCTTTAQRLFYGYFLL